MAFPFVRSCKCSYSFQNQIKCCVGESTTDLVAIGKLYTNRPVFGFQKAVDKNTRIFLSVTTVSEGEKNQANILQTT